ncbi:acyltransferase family protein [Mucilaginibacter auburnensis]|uniref:Peptidoglycan/LPS O-acetylase OafA/YrhL n=1 Tax=Mucilaginibacter auburnensis TaxID=1457233 RepID=A0A2H9VVX7_9SPHI|nr:acyltransferase [Mucilaginibacter auburnensis]PJJ84967.1 peptidoglycan/LPS O-acetylase OafA/YrhL [Mucilaginibacter auburnensis]
MKERFEVLDIFRGIFSSLVVFFHMSTFSDTPVINNRFILNCDLFVDFFFVLSGFVIAYSYQSVSTGEELNRFYKKRFFRLYPLHFIVLMAFVAIEVLKHFAAPYVQVNNLNNPANNVTTFLSNLFLLNSVKLPGVNDVSWNIASWSISAEMIAYLVFGITILQIGRGRLGQYRVWIFAGVAIASATVMHFFTGTFGLLYTFNYGFLRGITGFFTGVLCFTTFNVNKTEIRNKGNGLFSFLEILMLATTITLVCYGETFKTYGFVYLAAFFVTILVFAFEKGWLSTQLKKSKFLHTTGRYSYSIYMIHTLILSLFNVVFFRVLKLPPSAYAYMFIVNYAIIWVASAWTFKHIEMRFNVSGKKEPGKKGWWVW